MRFLLILCALGALIGCRQNPQRPATETNQAQAEAGPVKGVDRSHKGKPFPDAEFLDEEDQPLTSASFRGEPTLVNLWATWCAPCVKELPTLEKLSKQSKSALTVATISQDMAPRASVEAFLEDHKLDIPLYRDPKMAISGALGAEVLPTTILYDADGKEVWRYVGDLDWTGAEAAKLLAEAGASRRP
jgi:thiol-disulfide isomerase/thioredoxin